MSPSDSDSDADDPRYVRCPSCGAKAPSGWSFCRSCEASLEDAPPARPGVEPDEDMPAFDDEYGCPKCGHTEASVDEIAVTGSGMTKLLDLQNRNFSAVSCDKCGYTEFYKMGRSDLVVDFFLGG